MPYRATTGILLQSLQAMLLQKREEACGDYEGIRREEFYADYESGGMWWPG